MLISALVENYDFMNYNNQLSVSDLLTIIIAAIVIGGAFGFLINYVNEKWKP